MDYLTIPYYNNKRTESYITEKCNFGSFLSNNVKNFSTVIWLHTRELSEGKKQTPHELKDKKIAVVGVNYRLNPKENTLKYNKDTANAGTLDFKNIEKNGGNKDQIFVLDHSTEGNTGTKENSVKIGSYNKKTFIAPNSITSMSAIHCKIMDDGKAIARISDCYGSIRWHNQINIPEEREELLEKLNNAISELLKFRNHIENAKSQIIPFNYC